MQDLLLLDYFTTLLIQWWQNLNLWICDLTNWGAFLLLWIITERTIPQSFEILKKKQTKKKPSLSAAIRHLESLLVQLGMNCFINLTAYIIISFLFHQIKLKAAWFFICQMSRNFSIVYLNILPLYKLP